MNLQYSMPPQLTGAAAQDAAALSIWCGGLLTQLKKVITNIEDTNIISVSADKLSGGAIQLYNISMSGGALSIDGSSVIICGTDENGSVTYVRMAAGEYGAELLITNKDGDKYIRMLGGRLEICADSITAATVEAEDITAGKMKISGRLDAGTIHCTTLDADYINGIT